MILRPQFERLWADSSPEQQQVFKNYLDSADKDSILQWIQEHPSFELAEKKLKELKRIAIKLGIKCSRIGKLELVRLIQTRERDYGTQQSTHA